MFLNKLRNNRGLSLVEMMVSLIITGVITTGALQFFSDMNGRTLTQQDLSEMQNTCRMTMSELETNIRMAGYKIGSHAPFEIVGDTFFVYRRGTSPVDTICYFLQAESDVQNVQGAHQLYRMMKKTNPAAAVPMSDHLRALTFTRVDSANIQVDVTAESVRRDQEYTGNDGFKSYSLTELIKIRNVN